MASGIPSHHGASPHNRSQSPGGGNSPVDPSGQQPSSRSPFGLAGGIMAGNSRSGAGSPSHDLSGSGRLFSKRFVTAYPEKRHLVLCLPKLIKICVFANFMP